MGCGEAVLAASVPHKVYSFDMKALNERVTVADMANTPLQVTVFYRLLSTDSFLQIAFYR